MATSLFRQPRLSLVGPGGRRAGRLLVVLAAVALAVSAVLLQPFAASHLLPDRAAMRPIAPTPTAPVAAASPDVVAPAPAPASAMPAATATKSADEVAEPPVAISSSVLSLVAPPRPVAVTRSADTALAEPLKTAVQPVPAPAKQAAGNPVPSEASSPAPPANAIGGTPTPREPLPLQTDLIGPDPPGAAEPVPAKLVPGGGIAPTGSATTTERNG